VKVTAEIEEFEDAVAAEFSCSYNAVISQH
jgi:hypothetical protein